MFLKPIADFIASHLFANLLLFTSIVFAFAIGYRQIYLNDIVELYAHDSVKSVKNSQTQAMVNYPIIAVRNIGNRPVYLDRYIFNGTEYQTNGQILPQSEVSEGLYWIDLPTNGTTHVSISLHYHDLDERKWRSVITADFVEGIWKVTSLPRVKDAENK